MPPGIPVHTVQPVKIIMVCGLRSTFAQHKYELVGMFKLKE